MLAVNRRVVLACIFLSFHCTCLPSHAVLLALPIMYTIWLWLGDQSLVYSSNSISLLWQAVSRLIITFYCLLVRVVCCVCLMNALKPLLPVTEAKMAFIGVLLKNVGSKQLICPMN